MDTMNAVALRIEGLKRMSAGFSLFCEAMVDAGRGLKSMLSGAALLVAAAWLTLWAWICLPFVSLLSKGAPRALSWRWFRFPGLHFFAPVVRWGAWGLVAVLVIAGIGAVIDGIGPAVRQALPDARSFLLPLAVFAALAVVGLVAFLTIRLAAPLIISLGRFLTRQGVYAIAAFLVVVLAGAAGVVLYAVFQPSLVVIALIAGLALLAGFAGIAVISFGPSMFSVVRFGGQGGTTGGPAAGVMGTSPPASWARLAQPSLSQVRPAIGSQAAGVAPALVTQASGSAAPPFEHVAASDVALVRDGRSGAWTAFRWRWIAIALLLILALALAWFGGQLLLRAFSGNAQPGISASKPAAPPAVASVIATPRAVGPQAIQLLADGLPADVSWRSGYRNLTARLDDGGAVRALALPQTACDAGAIVVLGSASSDGAASRSHALALRRARWLADWTRSQLTQCTGTAPAVIAVSLGQARSEPPLPAQRGVRLMAIRQEDLAGLASASDPAKNLRSLAGAVFGDLADFERFEGCTLLPSGIDTVIQGLPEACETADR
jgi:hypothetical protein